MKKLKWNELEGNRYYYLCCPENQHIDVVFAFRYPSGAIELMFPGDQIRQDPEDYDKAEFYQVEKPACLGEGWDL